MKKILFTALFTIICFYTNAQVQILVDNNGTETVYDNINDALTNAQSGAKIYLPKGTFTLGTIDKELHFYGTGYRDGTKLYSVVNLISGSNNSSFSGVEFNGLNIGYNENDDIRNITFSRCLFNGGLYQTHKSSSYARNFNFSECIIYTINNNGNSEFHIYEKCIIKSYITGNNCSLKNCIFFNYATTGYNNSINNIFENSIFVKNTSQFPLQQTRSCIFINNLFVYDYSTPYVDNTFTNNIVNIPISDIFESYDESGFSFDHNYTLKATCPGKNAGTDGTDMGIYGTEVNGIPTPALEFGSIGNPQIYESEIASDVDAEGKLNMTIRIKAQEY